MDIEFKYYIENNFDFLVKLYNRYIRYQLRNILPLEYYASPYMNLMGYPSSEFIVFCKKYYNKKYKKNLSIKTKKYRFIKYTYLHFILFFLFIISSFFFTRKIKENSIIIDGIHSNDDFKQKPYRTVKTPPLEYFEGRNIYHNISISFVSIKSLFKYRENNIVFSLNNLSLFEFFQMHFIAFKIFIQSKKINIFPVYYYPILYMLVKGVSTANLINSLDTKSKYLHIWEKRGHQLITDLLIENKNKSIFLDLGVFFRLGPEYMMLNYLKHDFRSIFLFMSEFNYDMSKKYLKGIEFFFFKNYRIDCKNYNLKGKRNSILLISPLALDASQELYKLILDNKNNSLNLKIRLHPYLNKSSFDTKYVEPRNIYNALDDYDTIIYTGITSAAVELYFQGKNIYKFTSNDFFDIDVLVDNDLVQNIESLKQINYKNQIFIDDKKEYYLGCSNKNLREILEEIGE